MPESVLQREIRLAALVASSALFTLAGYEFIRSSSTVLFKSIYGADNLPIVMALMPLAVFAGVAVYARILTALGPRRTLLVTTLGSGVLMVLCYLGVRSGSGLAAALLYLLREFYIVLLIEQYWSYINSSLRSETAKKLNGPITGIAGLGGAIGGWLLALSAEPLGTQNMVLLAALSTLPAAFLSNLAYRRYGEPERRVEATHSGHMGWRLFRESPTLRYLLAIVLTTQVVSALLELQFQTFLSADFAGQTDRETAFQGAFFSWLNSSVLVLQFLVAPLLLYLLRLRVVHILIPAVHLAAVTHAIVAPSVFSVGLAFFLFKAFDYSVFRAAKEILYIPLSFDVRYRAKEVIDVFGYRTGKGASSVGILLAQRLGAAVASHYTQIALVAVAIWLALVFPLTAGNGQQRATRDGPSDVRADS